MRCALWLSLLAACASVPPEDEDVPADRDAVAASLYRQLDLVAARFEELRGEADAGAAAERDELRRLAHEIAVRIVRIDPDADVRGLVARVERLG